MAYYGRKRTQYPGGHPGSGIQIRLYVRHRNRTARQGALGRGRARDFGPEGRAGVDDRAARGGLPPLADARAAHVGPPAHPRNRFSGHHLLCGAQGEETPRLDGRGRSRAQAHVRQTGHSARGADGAGRRCRRCRDGLRLGEDHFPRDAGREGHHLLLDLGGTARPSRSGPQVPRERRPLYRQLLCGAQCRGLLRRVVLLHPEGSTLPDGAFDLFPHQCRGHRTVRAHAHRGRRRGLRELPRGMYGPDARREPAARRRRGDRRRARRRGQVLDRAELVPGRPRGAGRHL